MVPLNKEDCPYALSLEIYWQHFVPPDDEGHYLLALFLQLEIQPQQSVQQFLLAVLVLLRLKY